MQLARTRGRRYAGGRQGKTGLRSRCGGGSGGAWGGGGAAVRGAAGRMVAKGMGERGGALTLTSTANDGSCAMGCVFLPLIWIGVTRGVGRFVGRVFVRPGKLLNAVFAER